MNVTHLKGSEKDKGTKPGIETKRKKTYTRRFQREQLWDERMIRQDQSFFFSWTPTVSQELGILGNQTPV